MEKFKIYLAGACRGLPDEGKDWRKRIKTSLNHKAGFSDKEIVIYDPTEYFSRDGNDCISDKQVKNFYLKYLIKNCDLVLVNLKDTKYSVGTGMELQYAIDKEIPVIGFSNKNAYEWLPDCCDVVLDYDVENAVAEYIYQYYL